MAGRETGIAIEPGRELGVEGRSREVLVDALPATSKLFSDSSFGCPEPPVTVTSPTESCSLSAAGGGGINSIELFDVRGCRRWEVAEEPEVAEAGRDVEAAGEGRQGT